MNYKDSFNCVYCYVLSSVSVFHSSPELRGFPDKRGLTTMLFLLVLVFKVVNAIEIYTIQSISSVC